MSERLDSKVAIITGGASGIGEAAAERFIEEGARVAITDRNEPAGRTLADRLGPNALFLRHEVRSESDWNRVVDETVRYFGALNILVNNAGYSIAKPIDKLSLAEWREMFAVHSEAAFIGSQLVIPHMVRAGGGAIVNISSLVADFGDANVIAYSAAKASLHGLTRSLTAHCRSRGYPIHCNAILPGGIETPLLRDMIYKWADELGIEDTTAYRATLGQPVDLANVILFLASPEARYVGGQILLVDGGRQHVSHTHFERLRQLRASQMLDDAPDRTAGFFPIDLLPPGRAEC